MEQILSYSREKFPFGPGVSRLLGGVVLEQLHALLPAGVAYPPAPPGQDQNTLFHRRFYEAVIRDDDFLALYEAFVHHMAPVVLRGEPYLHQRIPSLRVQVPGGQAAGGTSHRDADYHHPDGEVNLLLPLTRMSGSNTLFLESAPGRRDFRFIELEPGQVLVFDGRNCEHGNVPNTNDWTRVSFDFRLLPRARYNAAYERRSVAYGLRFTEGQYYAAAVGPASAAGAGE